MIKRLATVCGVLLVTVVLAEVVLQCGALFVSSFVKERGAEPIIEEGRTTVLCVGDSFTFGIGATSPANSYPGQLEEVLNQEAPQGNWRVINAGFSGRSSAEVMAEISRRFKEGAPDYLVFAGACNDFWKFPEPTTFDALNGAADTAGFRFECRLLKLMRTIRGGDVFAIEAGKDAAGEGGANARGENELAVDEFVYEPSPVDPEGARLLGQGWNFMSAGEFAQGEEQFLLAQEFEPARARHALIGSYVALHRSNEEIDEVLSELASLHNAEPTEDHAEAWLGGIFAAQRWDVGTEVTVRLIEEHPESFHLRFFGSEIFFNLGDYERAAELSNEAEGLINSSIDRSQRGWFWASRARIFVHGDNDRVQSERAVVEAHRLDRDFELTRTNYLKTFGFLDDESLERSKDFFDHDDPLNQEALAIRAEVVVPMDVQKTQEILRGHLEEIAREADARGAHLVLSSYPISDTKIQDVLTSASDAEELPLARVDLVFADHLKEGEWDDFFVADGHCNDRGYRIMAEVIAETLLDGWSDEKLDNLDE